MKINLDILIVEDELDLREVFRDMLKMLGCNVIEACNGQEALAELEKQPFDVLFTDIQMPEMDGCSLIHSIYNLKLAKAPEIFIMTGRIETDTHLELGADAVHLVKGFLSKPFSYKQISILLQECFQNKQSNTNATIAGND
ncbi:MAG: response regulator [Pseudobdellovibrio sp.]